MVKASAILLNILFVLVPVVVKPQVKPETRPNVVIIMADDLDSRQLSCYGGQNIKTKNIDQLASEGNLAGDPAYATKNGNYTKLLKDWMKQQNDEGASADRVYK